MDPREISQQLRRQCRIVNRRIRIFSNNVVSRLRPHGNVARLTNEQRLNINDIGMLVDQLRGTLDTETINRSRVLIEEPTQNHTNNGFAAANTEELPIENTDEQIIEDTEETPVVEPIDNRQRNNCEIDNLSIIANEFFIDEESSRSRGGL